VIRFSNELEPERQDEGGEGSAPPFLGEFDGKEGGNAWVAPKRKYG